MPPDKSCTSIDGTLRIPLTAVCVLCLSLCSKLNGTLNQLELAHNDFEGDLSALAGLRFLVVSTSDNPKLCGMVPMSVRYAHGYNPGKTQLGRPCPVQKQS